MINKMEKKTYNETDIFLFNKCIKMWKSHLCFHIISSNIWQWKTEFEEILLHWKLIVSKKKKKKEEKRRKNTNEKTKKQKRRALK